jgi:hypothetical protein
LGCSETSDANVLTQTFQLQQQLHEWNSSLPPEIKTVSVSELSAIDVTTHHTQRYRFVLTLRYLNTQLLLHRAVLAKLLGENLDASQTHAPILQMQRNLCRTSSMFAQEILTIVYAVLTDPRMGKNFLGAWWFTLYYGRVSWSSYWVDGTLTTYLGSVQREPCDIRKCTHPTLGRQRRSWGDHIPRDGSTSFGTSNRNARTSRPRKSPPRSMRSIPEFSFQADRRME